MQKYSDADWELFRNRYPEWIERYMGSIIASYQRILDSDTTASSKFWEIEKSLYQVRDSAGAVPPFRITRNYMVYNMQAFLRDGVIDETDLEGFSTAVRREVLRGRDIHCW